LLGQQVHRAEIADIANIADVTDIVDIVDIANIIKKAERQNIVEMVNCSLMISL
jgi:hypothetical protein